MLDWPTNQKTWQKRGQTTARLIAEAVGEEYGLNLVRKYDFHNKAKIVAAPVASIYEYNEIVAAMKRANWLVEKRNGFYLTELGLSFGKHQVAHDSTVIKPPSPAIRIGVIGNATCSFPS